MPSRCDVWLRSTGGIAARNYDPIALHTGVRDAISRAGRALRRLTFGDGARTVIRVRAGPTSAAADARLLSVTGMRRRLQ